MVLLEDVGTGDVDEVQGDVDELPGNILLSRKHHRNIEDCSWELCSIIYNAHNANTNRDAAAVNIPECPCSKVRLKLSLNNDTGQSALKRRLV